MISTTLSCLAWAACAAGLGPAGEVYSDQHFAGPFDKATGMTFDALGRLFVWERAGRVFFVDADGTIAEEPLVDLSEEVGNWSDHGLHAVALDPGFASNGLVYLFYVVDHHYLTHFGLPTYDPFQNETWTATIARITRYRVVDPSLPGDQLAVDLGSRRVLVGDTIEDGFPVCSGSHSNGALLFGEDGSLLASFGDAQSGIEFCDVESGLLSPAEDVNRFRAQLVDSLAGKVLRLNPSTGDGLPNNPYFDPLEPRAPRSRVWALGLRNPFRMTVRPSSGSGNQPGTLYIGDVGHLLWEELNVAYEGGLNFGWPLYEGVEPQPVYSPEVAYNLDAPNPLFGLDGCDQEHFQFADLLSDDVQEDAPVLFNPCDQQVSIPAELVMEHERPALSWRQHTGPAVVPTFTDGVPTFEALGTKGSPVQGESFSGNASIAGVWYSGTDFPEPFQGTYFQADFGEGWIRSLRFSQSDRLLEVQEFTDGVDFPVALATHPLDGGLYYIHYPPLSGAQVRRITFVDDLPPIALAEVEQLYGASPLTVELDGSASFDEVGITSAVWDFGDGAPAEAGTVVQHTYTAPDANPVSYTATLTVTDAMEQSSQATVLVSLNNTPPIVEIESPLDGEVYSSLELELVDLIGAASDAEHPSEELTCTWDVLLHHDNHAHPEPMLPGCINAASLGPHTEDGEVEYFEVRLTVSDPEGLETSSTHYLPREDDCNLNGFPDDFDIAQGLSLDLDEDGTPDECAGDCDGDGLTDAFELYLGFDTDCNGNGRPDGCDLALGSSTDYDADGTPDDCQAFSVEPATISLSTGGAQSMLVNVGPEYTGEFALILGSMTGPFPVQVGGFLVPLFPDGYFFYTAQHANSEILVDTAQFLSPEGATTAQFVLPAGLNPGLAGLTLHHAAVIFDENFINPLGIELVTNPMPLMLVP